MPQTRTANSGCYIAGRDSMACTEVLEVFAGELASVVHHNTARGPVVCHILPHVFYDVVCVFGFEGKKLTNLL